jgi:hypothetical protein
MPATLRPVPGSPEPDHRAISEPARVAPKARLNPEALAFASPATSNGIGSPDRASDATSQASDAISACGEEPDAWEGSQRAEEDMQGNNDPESHSNYPDSHPAWGWESPQVRPALRSPAVARCPGAPPAPKARNTDSYHLAVSPMFPSQGVLPSYHPAMHAPAPRSPGAKDAEDAAAGPLPAPMHHHPHHHRHGGPPYSWSGPFPVWYPELERSASPPAGMHFSPAGGSPPLPPGFLAVPLREPGSPPAHGAVMYAHHPHHGGAPPGYASPPPSMGSSPQGGHYMLVHPHGYGPAPPHHQHHQQQHHPYGGPHHHHGHHSGEYQLAHHMGGMALRGPGSAGSGGGGGGGGSSGGGQSRASARIARSHRAGGSYDPQLFEFDLAEADAGGDGARTTLMIKNVPNKYSQATMLEVLHEAGFAGTFDFFYLPVDFRNRCGLGYAFVNMLSSGAAARLHRAFHATRWDEHNSRKVCEVRYARVQGRDALVEHFRASKFPSDDPAFQPLVYETADEGGEAVAVDPLPIHAFLGTPATGRAGGAGAEGGSPRGGGGGRAPEGV